ncbi:MAG: class I SAM-dependent methyltransferase, partial [Hyphomicrobium sp.]
MDQNSENASRGTASFGFRTVAEGERQGLVNKVFASVADRYDLMNDLMSGGLHRLWKRDLITMLNAPRSLRPFKLLDVAGGTGDIAIRYAKDSGANATAVICDISPEMLDVGRRRIADAGLDQRISCVEGNAEDLPFESAGFDAYTIA